ncbi:MAG TPA: 2-oxoacid:acceptor oxidoreductase family protein [Smithella sp.]|nr:2-oxoacid:acceptor oxidoreductase family protein [Smithella sp.]MDM7987287.1 2-oxoacid:acceptor oxidoreductase family protein [Smithella sp.]HNY50042.1 2-oxoacid:acceptor oxidoreductase family protein [Smithella sp.]HOG89799.1 2-oxoacid:acceptor oxidoreductase family protein [Smithella sp.]HOU50044.1 2-oxoacid:acceptor oxidoreductase family protein [Smithella sp.]
MIVKTFFSGFGGQGVLMMGISLANSAMNKGYHVTYLPAYGAEMRGGTANCTVAIGDEEIASPVSSEPDYLIVMNSPSLFTFQNKITSGGTIFINSSIINDRPKRQDVKVVCVPCADLALELGNSRVANVIMMGAFIKISDIVSSEIYLKSLETIMGSRKKALAEINRKAFAAGYDYVKA